MTITVDYDKNGNRVHQLQVQQAKTAATTISSVSISGSLHNVKHEQSAQTANTEEYRNTYDSMQRSTFNGGTADTRVVGPDNPVANQGFEQTYDKNGNIASSTTWGYQVVAQIALDGSGQPDPARTTYVIRTGLITRYFSYDADNRVTSVAIASYDPSGKRLPQSLATIVDQRFYDGNGRLVQEGLNNSMAPAYLQALQNRQLANAAEAGSSVLKRYEANGNLLSETANNSQGQLSLQTDYTQYDAEGHLQAYTSHDNIGNKSEVKIQQIKAEGYLQDSIQSSYGNSLWSGLGGHSTRQFNYDVNGNLIETNIDETNQYGNTKTVAHELHDANGKTLQTERMGGKIAVNKLLINGEVFHESLGTTVNDFSSNKGNGTGKVDTWQSETSATQALLNNLRLR